jgi:hypothetical protein
MKYVRQSRSPNSVVVGAFNSRNSHILYTVNVYCMLILLRVLLTGEHYLRKMLGNNNSTRVPVSPELKVEL